MNGEVLKTLKKLLQEYGEELCTNRQKLEGLLKDFCGRHRREISVLTAAAGEGIAEELRRLSGAEVDEFAFQRLVKRLHENGGIDEQYAEWAVRGWALALGKKPPKSSGGRSQPFGNQGNPLSVKRPMLQGAKLLKLLALGVGIFVGLCILLIVVFVRSSKIADMEEVAITERGRSNDSQQSEIEVSGYIYSITGTPLSGRKIIVDDSKKTVAISDANGYFSSSGIPIGSDIFIQHDSSEWIEPEKIKVRSSALLNFTAYRIIQISGTVNVITLDLLRGGIWGISQKKQELGIRVVAKGPKGNKIQSITDENGHFVLPRVLEGTKVRLRSFLRYTKPFQAKIESMEILSYSFQPLIPINIFILIIAFFVVREESPLMLVLVHFLTAGAVLSFYCMRLFRGL